MIIFGTRQRTVTGSIVEGVQCPSCGHDRFQTFGYQHYVHLYWIPTLPIGRTTGMACTHCKHTLVDDEIPEDFDPRVLESVFSNKSRLPMFSGLFILVALITFGLHAIRQDDAASAAYLAEPRVGDFYVVDHTKVFPESDDEYKYGVWHLAEVTEDYRRFEVSDSVYRLATGARRDIREGVASGEIDKTQDGVYAAPDDMAAWQASGAVYSVQRP